MMRSHTFSGFPSVSHLVLYLSFSHSTTSAGTDSLSRYVGLHAAICSATTCANSWNSAFRATKSV